MTEKSFHTLTIRLNPADAEHIKDVREDTMQPTYSSTVR